MDAMLIWIEKPLDKDFEENKFGTTKFFCKPISDSFRGLPMHGNHNQQATKVRRWCNGLALSAELTGLVLLPKALEMRQVESLIEDRQDMMTPR